MAGAIAPAAQIAVYFAPNTDQGFLDAVTTAIHDATNKPSVISISWGGPESSWTQQSMTAFDQAFQDAAAMGITVCVAAGDNGSGDGASGDNVDFPASSPYALACGGTSVQASNNSITSETVWNDGAQGGSTGGGISSFFPLPPYQEGLSAALTARLIRSPDPDCLQNQDEQREAHRELRKQVMENQCECELNSICRKGAHRFLRFTALPGSLRCLVTLPL